MSVIEEPRVELTYVMREMSEMELTYVTREMSEMSEI
jgi:hypothetical protein